MGIQLRGELSFSLSVSAYSQPLLALREVLVPNLHMIGTAGEGGQDGQGHKEFITTRFLQSPASDVPADRVTTGSEAEVAEKG